MGRRCLALCAEQHAARLRFGERQDRYPIVSLWNIGDSLIALSAARRLDLIPQREFDARLSALLTTLDRLPVTRIGAPGALYDAVSGAFSQNGGTAGEAQGMARLLVGMRFTAQSFPEYRTFLERIALRWNFCNLLTQDGQPLDGREQTALAQCRSQRRRLCRLQRRGFPPVGISAYINANGTVQNRGRLR